MDVRAETRRCVAEWLDEHEESRARLRSRMNADYTAAYEMLTCGVYQRMRKSIGDDWRKWLEIQFDVRDEIQNICDEMTG